MFKLLIVAIHKNAAYAAEILQGFSESGIFYRIIRIFAILIVNVVLEIFATLFTPNYPGSEVPKPNPRRPKFKKPSAGRASEGLSV